jgi:hypothetical protein
MGAIAGGSFLRSLKGASHESGQRRYSGNEATRKFLTLSSGRSARTVRANRKSIVTASSQPASFHWCAISRGVYSGFVSTTSHPSESAA